MIKSFIKSVGGYLPKKIVTNDELSKTVDTSHEWIFTRTGISQRHIAEENEYTSDMCCKAAEIAIENAGIKKEDIDLIIVATTTPDQTFPSTAALTQKKLGMSNTECAAFDVQAVCSGFVYALSIADSLIKTGKHKNALVLGADKMSSIVDWNDRGTCVLFGDGAGAVILSVTENDSESSIIDFDIKADGSLDEILYTDGGIGSNNKSGVVKMNGREVFRHAVEKMSRSLLELMQRNSINPQDIAYVVPHQANLRIINAVAKKLSLDESKAIATVEKHSNTSAASIPLALYENYTRFNRGDIVLMTAAGGGFTWGSMLLKW
ncbi:MAG: beta-ketoacyl-ACP synthase III [Rickettsiales bacterium]